MQSKTENCKVKKILIFALAVTLLCAMALAGAGCVEQLDLQEAHAAIMEAAGGKPILLYISATG